MTNTRFTIQDFIIIDAESDPIPKIHIRELLDYPSYEFQSSKLSERQKLDVIETIGLEILTNVLHEYFQYKRATYNAVHEAQFTWLMMRKEMTLQSLKNAHAMGLDFLEKNKLKTFDE